MTIYDVHKEIIDSRGNPTIEVDVTLESGFSVRRGAFRCRRKTICVMAVKRFLRRCCKAVKNVLFPESEGMDALDQVGIDNVMLA